MRILSLRKDSKRAMVARFGGRKVENLYEEQNELKQVGTVEEYIEAFEFLSSQLRKIPEEQVPRVLPWWFTVKHQTKDSYF